MSIPDSEALRRSLDPATQSTLDEFEVFAELPSTNQYLLDQPQPSAGRFRIAMAEHQTAGRGRRGKQWYAPPSSSICLSMAYTFRASPKNLSSLSLAAGVAVVDVLQVLPMRNAALKWPNDIMADDAKLGGILIETRGNASPPTTVIGLGLNYDLAGFDHADIAPDRPGPITDLSHCVDELASRDSLTGRLVDSLVRAVQRFDAQGFAAFVERWNRCDWLKGREMAVNTPAGYITGAADGVDQEGGLLLMTPNGPQTIISGSVVFALTAGDP